MCGPVSSTFSANFSANSTDVHVDVYSGSSCKGAPYEQRDVGLGACEVGALSYTLVSAAPASETSYTS